MEYITALGKAYPTIGAYCSGDGTVYENLVWESGPALPTKAELDAVIFTMQKSDMISAVDALADEVYTVAVSSPAKLLEYQEAEKEAVAFKANNEDLGSYITVWAVAKGWTNDQAADDIILTANRFRSAMIYIRQERLAAKEGIRSSTTISGITSIMNVYTAKMMYLKAQLQATM